MRATLTGILCLAIASAALPTRAEAQRLSLDSLQRRIIALEERVAELERRLEAIGMTTDVAGGSGDAAPTRANRAAWRQLKRGMKMDEVRRLIGEPGSVMTTPYSTYWGFAAGGSIEFDRDGRLKAWMEP